MNKFDKKLKQFFVEKKYEDSRTDEEIANDIEKAIIDINKILNKYNVAFAGTDFSLQGSKTTSNIDYPVDMFLDGIKTFGYYKDSEDKKITRKKI